MWINVFDSALSWTPPFSNSVYYLLPVIGLHDREEGGETVRVLQLTGGIFKSLPTNRDIYIYRVRDR